MTTFGRYTLLTLWSFCLVSVKVLIRCVSYCKELKVQERLKLVQFSFSFSLEDYLFFFR